MVKKTDCLSPKQNAFAAAMVATGGNKHASAVMAGYKNPITAYQALRSPAVLAQIKTLQNDRLIGDCLPAATDYVLKTLRDNTAPHAARVKCASLVFNEARAIGAFVGGKLLSEMTPAELAAHLARCEEQLADKAKIVNAVEFNDVETEGDEELVNPFD